MVALSSYQCQLLKLSPDLGSFDVVDGAGGGGRRHVVAAIFLLILFDVIFAGTTDGGGATSLLGVARLGVAAHPQNENWAKFPKSIFKKFTFCTF